MFGIPACDTSYHIAGTWLENVLFHLEIYTCTLNNQPVTPEKKYIYKRIRWDGYVLYCCTALPCLLFYARVQFLIWKWECDQMVDDCSI